jgi:hypothetical protein
MFSMINKFFFDLTKRNWGAPWHVILAWIGTDLLFKIPFLQDYFVVAGIVLGVGLINEIVQKQLFTRDGAEDMLANIAGILLGIFL